MLDKLKAMGAIAGLMKNQDKLKESLAKVRAQMEQVRVTGSAGGGAATASVNGQMRVLSVELSPSLLAGMTADDRTRELAAGLIAEAVNNALSQAQAILKDAIDRESRELGLPELGASEFAELLR
jgi:nucleoid-associated protein EbfC